MLAPMAAGYCGEPSVEAFHAKLERGIYSRPALARGVQPKWHRYKLDQDIARRHGLQPAFVLAEDVEGLI